MHRLLKNRIFLTMMMFVSGMAAGAGMAQISEDNHGVVADIPFAFTAENTRLPSGDYRIVRISDVDSTFEVRNADETVVVLLEAETTNDLLPRGQTPELIFDKVGNTYFLRGLRTDDFGYTYPEPTREKTLVKQGMKVESHKVECTSM